MGPDGQTTNQAENRFARARAATSGPQGAWGCSSLLHPKCFSAWKGTESAAE